MIEYSLFLIVALAFATVLVIRQIARGSAQRINRLDDLEGRTKAVDLLAFRNLMDPEQKEFLRSSLPGAEYRRLQRRRIGVAKSYVRTVYANAAIMIRLGEALRSNPATLDDGVRILDLALKNRISAALLLVKLQIGWLYPDFVLSTERLYIDYSKLKEDFGGVLRRTMPIKGSRLVAGL
jgi:hypothetical protein